MSDSAPARRGLILLEQRRFPDAEKYFREALAADPNDALALYYLSLCLANQDRSKEALAAVGQAISLAPEEAAFHAFRAFILAGLKKPAEAKTAAEEAIALDPDSDYAHSALAAAFLTSSQWAKAESAARKALDLNPDNVGASNQLAHALRLQNRLQESADQAGYMLSQDPEDPQTHVTAGWIALQRGDQKVAEKHFLEALRLDASNEAAREGLKEAFRARSPLYRAYLSYCFFLQRFTEGKQWLVIIGLLVAVNVVRQVLPGPLALLVIVLYFLFVLWVHVARAVGNLQVSLDRVARYSLSLPEKLEAWAVGGSVLLGVPLFIAGVFAQIPYLLIPGLALVGSSFPFAYTFTNKSRVGRLVFGGTALYILGTGAFSLAAALGAIPQSSALEAAVGLAFISVMAVTWLANVRALNQR